MVFNENDIASYEKSTTLSAWFAMTLEVYGAFSF